MKARMLVSALLLSAALSFASNASTAQNSVGDRVAKHQVLRDSIERGEGKYAEIEAADKSRLMKAQDEIFLVLRGKVGDESLSGDERALVTSRETEIADILSRIDPRKGMVRCSFQARIGSNRKERVCKRIGFEYNADAKKVIIDLHQ